VAITAGVWNNVLTGTLTSGTTIDIPDRPLDPLPRPRQHGPHEEQLEQRAGGKHSRDAVKVLR
jgi:hypothetical protein